MINPWYEYFVRKLFDIFMWHLQHCYTAQFSHSYQIYAKYHVIKDIHPPQENQYYYYLDIIFIPAFYLLCSQTHFDICIIPNINTTDVLSEETPIKIFYNTEK